MRRLTAILALLLLFAAVATTPATAREFGTIYVDGAAYRTFAVPARVDAGTGTDPIISFTNFDQPGVAKYAPGPGSHGGRWAVHLATWTDPGVAHELTSFAEVMRYVEAGAITLERAPEADFRCPILPGNGGR